MKGTILAPSLKHFSEMKPSILIDYFHLVGAPLMPLSFCITLLCVFGMAWTMFLHWILHLCFMTRKQLRHLAPYR